jgi:hypothetical protein
MNSCIFEHSNYGLSWNSKETFAQDAQGPSGCLVCGFTTTDSTRGSKISEK